MWEYFSYKTQGFINITLMLSRATFLNISMRLDNSRPIICRRLFFIPLRALLRASKQRETYSLDKTSRTRHRRAKGNELLRGMNVKWKIRYLPPHATEATENRCRVILGKQQLWSDNINIARYRIFMSILTNVILPPYRVSLPVAFSLRLAFIVTPINYSIQIWKLSRVWTFRVS